MSQRSSLCSGTSTFQVVAGAHAASTPAPTSTVQSTSAPGRE
ncbi:hypothetical protein [Aeromicrobium sp. CTD01-1L150]